MSVVKKTIDTIDHHCLNKTNWNTLAKLYDKRGEFRSIVVGYDITDDEIRDIKQHFHHHPKWEFDLTFLRTQYPDDDAQPYPMTTIRIRVTKKKKVPG